MLVGRLAGLPGETGSADNLPQPITLRTAEPQRQLMAAVLQAVVDDYRGGSDRRRRHGRRPLDAKVIRRADAYVQSTDREWPFSFENLCEALDLDAVELRMKLAELRHASIARRRTLRTASMIIA